MSEAQRKPALGRVDPIAAAIPGRQPAASAGSGGGAHSVAGAPLAPVTNPASASSESYGSPLNTRVRASTRARLETAVNKLRFEHNDRSISIASLTDRALDTFLRDIGV